MTKTEIMGLSLNMSLRIFVNQGHINIHLPKLFIDQFLDLLKNYVLKVFKTVLQDHPNAPKL